MSLRVIFVGTPDFAVPSLREIHGSEHAVSLVIAQPDRASGRGRKVLAPTVKVAAREFGLPVYQPDSINSPESLEQLKKTKPDVMLVAAYGQKLSNEMLELPRLGVFNLHASLLPKYRGAAPITYAIWKGETETGLTIFKIVEEMDAGDMALKVSTPIGSQENAGELHDRLSEMGAELFVDFLDWLEAGNIKLVPQDSRQASFAPSLKKEQGEIDWQLRPEEVTRLVRAMTPWPGAYTFRRGRKGKPDRLTILESESLAGSTEPETGTVVEVAGEYFTVAAAGGLVRIGRLVPAGTRAMTAAEYLRGHPMEPGERLGPAEAVR